MAKRVRVPPRFGGQTKLALIEVIQPGPFRDEALRQEVRNAIQRTLTQMRQRFYATTRTWATRVEWDEVESTAGGVAYASMTTDDNLYYLIDHGAREHPIYPTEAPALIFASEYEAKTEPGVLASGEGFRGGDATSSAGLIHPGFDPRDFDETVREQVEPIFEREVQEALDRFARKSGHYLDT
jgi:hypothetical protein